MASNKMNKSMIQRHIAIRTGLDEQIVSCVLDEFSGVLKFGLNEYDHVQVSGLGNFKVFNRRRNSSLNSFGDNKEHAETQVLVSFKPSPGFKSDLKKGMQKND